MIITVTHEKKKYELGFNRKTAASLESQGFSIEAMQKMPSTMIPMLFYGAFAMRNPGIKRNLVDEIFGSLKGKQELVVKLAEMYAETVNSLMEDAPEGNTTWEVTE